MGDFRTIGQFDSSACCPAAILTSVPQNWNYHLFHHGVSLSDISYHDLFLCLTGSRDTVLQRPHLNFMYINYFMIFKVCSGFHVSIYFKI